MVRRARRSRAGVMAKESGRMRTRRAWREAPMRRRVVRLKLSETI